jgi:hypothetical protein
MNIKEPRPHAFAAGAKSQSRNYSRWFFALVLGLSFALSAKGQSTLQEPTIKLLDAGSGSRKTLRLHLKAGDKESTTMTMKIGMDMAGQSIKMPTMNMPMDLTVQSVAPNGDITYTMVMGEPSVANDPGAMPAMVQAMKTALASVKGLTISGVLSDRGISKQADMKIPEGADPSMHQSMDQMKQNMSNLGAPFPQEAIGAGAKWEVKTRLNSGGIGIDQTATYELASLKGDQWSVKCTMAQSAEKQKIQNPDLGSVQMNLVKLTSTGTGTISSELSKVIPLHGSIDSHVDMNSEIVMAQTNQPMAMKMDMNIGIDSK